MILAVPLMIQILAIARNTLLQTIRQPIYGIIVLVTLGGLALAPSLTGWTLDDDNKLLRDIGLSTLLIQGLFLAVFAASSTLHAEIDDKTTLTVVSKPVQRTIFILGKYLGLLGAVAAAHYLAGIALFMAMRHGVLQSAADTSDVTVLVLGPGMVLVLAIAATVLNYIYDWRFLPTLITLALPFLSLSTLVLMVVDRDWKLQTYESAQPIERLPPECAEAEALRGIIEFRPNAGQLALEGHSGALVHNDWKGPITIEQQNYLLGLHDSIEWRRNVNLLIDKTRQRQGTEIFKAGLLLFVAVGLLAAFAILAATRLGVLAAFMTCVILLCAGLSSDQVIKPIAESGKTWAAAAYRIIPNFQIFWMVDALSEHLVIPWGYVGAAAGYGLLYTIAVLILAMAFFETREVG